MARARRCSPPEPSAPLHTSTVKRSSASPSRARSARRSAVVGEGPRERGVDGQAELVAALRRDAGAAAAVEPARARG